MSIEARLSQKKRRLDRYRVEMETSRQKRMRTLQARFDKVEMSHTIATYRLLIDDDDTDEVVVRFTFSSLAEAIVAARELHSLLSRLNQEFFVIDLSRWDDQLRHY